MHLIPRVALPEVPGRDHTRMGWLARGSHTPPIRALSLRAGDLLVAVTAAGRTDKTVQARKLRVLVDADLTSWQAWNDFATELEFAEATEARVVHIDDGGIAGSAFHDRALRLNGGAGVLEVAILSASAMSTTVVPAPTTCARNPRLR